MLFSLLLMVGAVDHLHSSLARSVVHEVFQECFCWASGCGARDSYTKNPTHVFADVFCFRYSSG